MGLRGWWREVGLTFSGRSAVAVLGLVVVLPYHWYVLSVGLVIESPQVPAWGDAQQHKISAQDSNFFRRPKAAPLRYPSNHDAPNIGANAGSHPAELPIDIHMRLATHHNHLAGGRDPRARRQRHGGTCMFPKIPCSLVRIPFSSFFLCILFLLYETLASVFVLVRSLAYTCARVTPTTHILV
jgi:hypothetical protein